jgi:mersacidin/lichenicidin family type 2 lantibiotic
MSNKHIIRAWKDAAYRNSLSETERAALPPNPAGGIEISDADLGKVAGGAPNTLNCSLICTVNPVACTALCSAKHTTICATASVICKLIS